VFNEGEFEDRTKPLVKDITLPQTPIGGMQSAIRFPEN
jgi:hypothetical protein